MHSSSKQSTTVFAVVAHPVAISNSGSQAVLERGSKRGAAGVFVAILCWFVAQNAGYALDKLCKHRMLAKTAPRRYKSVTSTWGLGSAPPFFNKKDKTKNYDRTVSTDSARP